MTLEDLLNVPDYRVLEASLPSKFTVKITSGLYDGSTVTMTRFVYDGEYLDFKYTNHAIYDGMILGNKEMAVLKEIAAKIVMRVMTE